MTRLNLAIPVGMQDWIEERVRSGAYSDASDYVRDLIRRDQQVQDQLIAALEEGERSGLSPRSVDEVIADARATASRGNG
jgi:antitoxin ParD1/3/4